MSVKVKILKNNVLQDFKALPLLRHRVIEKAKVTKVKFLIYISLCSMKNLRCLTITYEIYIFKT